VLREIQKKTLKRGKRYQKNTGVAPRASARAGNCLKMTEKDASISLLERKTLRQEKQRRLIRTARGCGRQDCLFKLKQSYKVSKIRENGNAMESQRDEGKLSSLFNWVRGTKNVVIGDEGRKSLGGPVRERTEGVD